MQWLQLTTSGDHEVFVNMSLAVHMRRFGDKTVIDMLTSSMDRTHSIGVLETPETILQKMCDCGWVSKQDGERARPPVPAH
ncbi:hypothetical protein ACFSCV_03390 [Methylopila henanensis]|uniref:Uncharacterized protein n=1 Tax=Methylopila henanensis TaxID=873516 RepID=A0ABW4K7K5_9HYPH